MRCVMFIVSQYDVFSKYKVNQYMCDFGLVVAKPFRNRGIATEFLKARFEVMKALNITVTSTLFTVIGSQKAAARANYSDGFSIKWSELGEIFTEFDFTKSNVESCKIMDYAI